MSLIRRPDCAWDLADLKKVKPNGVRVLTTFACGGGSTMGYKRAGCDVVAANDIDPEMAWHYKVNLAPKHYFLCPIRELITATLPDELIGIDILDGSPPCSTFSMAGSREEAWGKNKHFREGQAKQVLSDLFFDFLDLAERIKPKVIIAENVKGMILGNAKGYCKMIMARLRELGYRPQLFLLNAADCGVPQRRERVFFCAVRGDISTASLVLAPKHRWISAGEATQDLQKLTDEEMHETRITGKTAAAWHGTAPGRSFSEYFLRTEGKAKYFSFYKLAQDAVSYAITSQDDQLSHWSQCREMSLREIVRLGSFPDDYTFKKNRIGKYMVGMSVPPKMMEAVASAVCSQWLHASA